MNADESREKLLRADAVLAMVAKSLTPAEVDGNAERAYAIRAARDLVLEVADALELEPPRLHLVEPAS